jgi:hypothetical protein
MANYCRAVTKSLRGTVSFRNFRNVFADLQCEDPIFCDLGFLCICDLWAQVFFSDLKLPQVRKYVHALIQICTKKKLNKMATLRTVLRQSCAVFFVEIAIWQIKH